MATLESVRWDLTPLYTASDDERLQADLEGTVDEAGTFSDRYHGRVRSLSPVELGAAIDELERIRERMQRAESFAYLDFCTATADPARGALLQKVRERSAILATKLLFFQLEWAAVPDERAAEVAAAPELERWRHFLESAHRFRPHLLSEPEEKVLAEKEPTSRAAWVRLFTQVTETIRVSLEGSEKTLDEALAVLYDPERERRQAAGRAVTEALHQGLPTRTYILNTILADKSVEDRLRRYPSWIASRNLSNEIEEQTVQALVDAVTSRYDLPARWYQLKARLLGLEELDENDRYAPLLPDEREVDWDEAVETVLGAYNSFSSEMAGIARGFLGGYIDAPPGPGKQGGAFAHPAIPSAHPFILLNYTSRQEDVMTLAHELGHGVHQVLASRLGLFNADTPLTLAECASIFGETVTFSRVLAAESDDRARLALLAGRLEGMFAAIFRQIAMNRFEDAVHTARREEGELSPDRFGEAWLRTQRAMFGDSVRLSDNYAMWWSYVPHFIFAPGYVYAYAFGNLLALSLYARYEAEGEGFVPSYLELLAAGGSESPNELTRRVGIDLTDPGFWSSGLASIDAQVSEAEALADAVGPSGASGEPASEALTSS